MNEATQEIPSQKDDSPRKRRRKQDKLVPATAEVQLAFHTALTGTPENTGYTLDFFEAIPKFKLSRQRYTDKPQIWETTFRWADQEIPVQIYPALVQRDPKKPTLHAIIPGPREEIVWRVLIELAAEQAATSTVSQMSQAEKVAFAPVRFSLFGLRERLASRGKTYRVSEIRETLLVLKRAECSLSHPLGAPLEDYSNYISHLHFRGEKLEDGTIADSCLAYLNPMATSAILNFRCWPIDNARLLKLSLPLARWLITRISNRYRQADQMDILTGASYHLMLSTILRESGIEREPRLRNSIARVRAAIKECTEAGYFAEFKPYTEEICPAAGSNRKDAIADVKWTFFPSGVLIDNIVNGNDTMKSRKKLHAQTSADALRWPKKPGV